jgi:ATP-dependent Lhr-like helicase
MPAAVTHLLHPDVAAWFLRELGEPTPAQEACVPLALEGRNVLLSSPTGTGKTLAGFLAVIDRLYREHVAGQLAPLGIRAIYVSPLRALTYDMRKNLEAPLAGLGVVESIRIASRSGDSSPSERAKQRRKPPHIWLTTPESLAIVLCQKGYREALARCEFVIVDELHALAETKRGAHLSISLERLERLAGRPLCRVGLSATVSPLETAARFLAGEGRTCEIVEPGVTRQSLVEVLTPLKRSAYPPAGYTGSRVIQDVARIVEGNRSTLIFTNTRSSTENISVRLKHALPDLVPYIEAHHSSLDRDVRLETEDRLKNGELRAVVCSTSLELGIDIGSVDSVVMLSTPKGISRALQRIGRSGHSVRAMSHGVLVATNINDLIECIVCAEMVKRRTLDPVRPMENPADVGIQHLVGMAMEGDVTPDEAFALIRRAHGFRNLPRAEFDGYLRYLEGGGESLEGAYRETFGKVVIVDGKLATTGRKVERDYLVNIGTIASDGSVSVRLGRKRLGSVEEGFAKQLKIGDCFVIGGQVVRLDDAGVGELQVSPARNRLPTIPAWNANKMPLASGLAAEVTRFRTEMWKRLRGSREEVLEWLVEEWNISALNAEAVLQHFVNQERFSTIPRQGLTLIEVFRDEERDPDLVHFFFHTLIGRSANDALSRIVSWRLKEAVGGNALVTIDDYGFLLSLKAFQALEQRDWRELFQPAKAMEDLHQALEGSQLVKWQFGGVAQTGLMVPRNLPGKERKVKQLRWSSEILFRVLTEHEPGHPLLRQAFREAMHTFLDVDRAIWFMNEAAAPDHEWKLIESPVVTPFSFGIYVSKIKEGMMMEDPEDAIERLFHEMSQKVTEHPCR